MAKESGERRFGRAQKVCEVLGLKHPASVWRLVRKGVLPEPQRPTPGLSLFDLDECVARITSRRAPRRKSLESATQASALSPRHVSKQRKAAKTTIARPAKATATNKNVRKSKTAAVAEGGARRNG